jgi:RimJ/RimL family protein N-acetyltransferase
MSATASIALAAPAPLDVADADADAVLAFRMCPADRPLVIEVVHALSAQSLYLRFGRPVAPAALDLNWVDALDGSEHVAYGALERATGRPLGVARYARDGARAPAAEVAVVVVDGWQGRGVGRLMVAALVAHARVAGVATLRASVLAGNGPALALMRGLGARPVAISRGTVELVAHLRP